MPSLVMKRPTVLIVVAALALAACDSEPASQPTATTQPAAAEAAAQPTATTQPAAAEAAGQKQEPATEQKDAAPAAQTVKVRDLVMVRADAPAEAPAAESLNAYRATYRLEIQEGGNATQSLEYISEADNEGRARQQSSVTESSGQKTGVSVYTVGQTSYTIVSDNENFCVALTGDEPTGIPQPRDWLNDIESAELAEQGVEVNGFLTDRYTFREKVETQEVQAEISGEVWVARESNMIVRHRGESVGKMAVPDSGAMQDARVAWEYSLEQLPDDFAVEIPAACLEGGQLPVPPAAKNAMRAGDITSFDIDSPVDEVVKFYKEEMQKAGWKLADENAYSNTVILSFEKGDEKVSAQISRDEQITRVILMLE